MSTPTLARRQYASPEGAAEYLCCSVKTIRRMVSRGQLTAYRVGPRLLRVDLAELDRALAPIPTCSGDAA